MTFLPVVLREMSVLSRRRITYYSRAITAFVSVLVMVWLLLVSLTRLPFSELGRSIFLILSSLSFAYALLVGAQATSDCISEEKREGTLGLLFLTDLKAYDVILGKMAASSLNAVYALLGVLPMLALAVLAGGVTLGQIGLVALILANTMFFSLALGALISCLSNNERKSIFASVVILLGITLGPFVANANYNGAFFQQPGLWISPLFPFLLVHSSTVLPAPLEQVLPSLMLHHLCGWGFLLASWLTLPRFINELPSRRFAWIREAVHNYAFGKREQRKKHRAKLLDRNAFLWLASRERVKPVYAWVIVLFFGLMWFWVWRYFPTMRFDFQVCGVIILLIHVSLKLWVASEVSSRLLEDRRSGGLELLLSTPLSVREVAHGQTLALRRIFLRPILFLVAAELAFAYMSVRNGPGERSRNLETLTFLALASTLVLDFWALKWLGLWTSLFGRSIEKVMIAVIARIMALPWLLYFLAMGLLAAWNSIQGTGQNGTEQLITWWLISVAVSLGFGLSARLRFFRYFRELASLQFDSAPKLDALESSKAEKVVPAGAASSAERHDANERERTVAAIPFRTRFARYLLQHWVVSSVAIVILAAIGAASIREMYYQSRLEREIARIRSAGMPATISDLEVYMPGIPNEQNAATPLLNAGIPSGNPRQEWVERFLASRNSSRARRQRRTISLEKYLENNRAQLLALHSLPSYDTMRMENGHGGMMNYGLFLKYQGLAGLEFTHALEEGDIPRLEKSLLAMIHFARLLRHDPTSSNYPFTWNAIEDLSMAMELAVAKDVLSAEFLETAAREVERIENEKALTDALHRFRGQILDPQTYAGAAPQGQVPVLAQISSGLMRVTGTDEEHKLFAAQLIEAGLQQVNIPPALMSSAMIKGTFAGAPQTFTEHVRTSIEALFWRNTGISAKVNVLRTGIAAVRFKHLTGQLPPNAEELVKRGLLPSLPQDPYTGGRIVVTRNGSGEWVAYSVGRNMLDEGGLPGPLWDSFANNGDVCFVVKP